MPYIDAKGGYYMYIYSFQDLFAIVKVLAVSFLAMISYYLHLGWF